MRQIISSSPTGTAGSFLGSSNVKPTRYAYHLTLAFLHELKLQAYADYCNGCNGLPEPIETWEERLLKDLFPYFFICRHTNYTRWLPVFLRDMARLPLIHPSVHDAFLQGKFVVQCSNKKLSLMAIDQSQEHSIKFLNERKLSQSYESQKC